MKYTVSEHGMVSGEAAMAAEIAARGPIVCGMCVTEAFLEYRGGVYGCAPSPAVTRTALAAVGVWGSWDGRAFCPLTLVLLLQARRLPRADARRVRRWLWDGRGRHEVLGRAQLVGCVLSDLKIRRNSALLPRVVLRFVTARRVVDLAPIVPLLSLLPRKVPTGERADGSGSCAGRTRWASRRSASLPSRRCPS